MRKFTLASILMILVLVLSACGNGVNNNNGEVGEDPNQLGTPGVVTTEEVPVTGETVVVTEPVVTETLAPSVEQTVVATETGDVVTVGLDDEYPNLLSEVLDLEIMTQDCEELAEIDGVVASRGDGQILYVVAVTGGAFELDQEVLVPFGALDLNLDVLATAEDGQATVDPNAQATATVGTDGSTTVEDAVCEVFENGEAYMLNAAVEDLQGAPSVFGENDDANLNNVVVNEGWDEELRGFWTNLGVTVNEAVDADMTTGIEAGAGNTVVIRDVGELNLRNLEDDEIGDIHDFILNPETGQITHVILSVGGFLGIGDRFVPVPWNALNWNVNEDGEFFIVLDANGDRLENAPGFDSLDLFPAVDVDGWDADTVTYWTTDAP
jgi:sporulation protein YlmC with PRC-barrel domain